MGEAKAAEVDPIAMASHRLCYALHGQNIDPGEVEILLPREAWWQLQCRLERHYRGVMAFDGRGQLSDRFRYMGVTYRPK